MVKDPAIYKICSYLLQYPDEKMKQSLETIKEIIKEIGGETGEHLLLPVVEYLQKTDTDDLITRYVQIFDFGKKTNLYVTYAIHGEQRERGAALLEIKQIYQKAGWQMPDDELPDYLPLMLEFAALSDDGIRLLERYAEHIRAIAEELAKADSLYQNVLRFIILTVEAGREESIAMGGRSHA
ncbi:nitrate reductase molybdenum cofactor assembly chaperone [Tuberibacillus calidus]|jgi:nitrate reductase delta subunit|uniref:nitrate reductase molybdenum cofactor assembly chaperone n=1 Tax=Tuberibacillus calidus TaxID=340097 RepID=UPI00040AE3DA|nr:nitrate reductase molybdenum cofactor assembly chaperone [Tuberibacillus calidus]